MNGYFIPPGLFDMSPLYLNFLENRTTIQFDHRMLAYVLMIYIPFLWYRSSKYSLSNRTHMAFHIMLLLFILQIILGITTLLMQVPVALAAMHQGGAILVLTAMLFIMHELRTGSKSL